MNIKDAYYELSLLVNKNSERREINIDILNYLILFNRESKRWLSEFIEKNNNSDNILTIAELAVHDKKLVKKDSKDGNSYYDYPKDYFSILAGNSYSTVKGACGESKVWNYFKKPNNRNIQLEDKFIQPSYQWERGLGELYSDNIVVYTTDFSLIDTYISYYKQPPYFNPKEFTGDSSNPKYNQEIDLSDYLIGQINDRIATEVQREFLSQGYQVAKTREVITL